MIQAPNINTKVATNPAVVAAFMDELVIQIEDSADTLRASAISGITGNAIAQTVSSMESRAKQIRDITADFRVSGEMARFDEACKLAGWVPDRQALEMLQVAH